MADITLTDSPEVRATIVDYGDKQRTKEWLINSLLENAPPHMIPGLCLLRQKEKQFHDGLTEVILDLGFITAEDLAGLPFTIAVAPMPSMEGGNK